MRVMVMVKATKNSEAGILPGDPKAPAGYDNLFEEMGKFNEQLVKAGVMLEGDGLRPSSKGKRVRFSGGKKTVIDGPFAETKELVAGYWIWQVKSIEEAVEWVRRCPDPMPGKYPKSRFGPFTRPRTSARNSLPSCRRRSSACAIRSSVGKNSKADEFVSPSPDSARRTIETVWRIESARLIGGLARLVRDVGLAEDLAQEALLVALERWPESGIPDNPGAWLMATAKNRALDQLRRHRMLERKHEELAGEASLDYAPATGDIESVLDEDVGDDLLRLMLIACHPVLSKEARAALTLRLLGGLSAEEIARAFLVPEPTIAQRIVRAKHTLAEARVPFEVPLGEDLSRRLESVLEVYLPHLQRGLRGDERGRLDAPFAL